MYLRQPADLNTSEARRGSAGQGLWRSPEQRRHAWPPRESMGLADPAPAANAEARRRPRSQSTAAPRDGLVVGEGIVARSGGRLEVEPISFPPITEEERAESSRQMARLARRWILVFCQVEGAMKWRAALEAAGAVYKRTCLWVKPDGKPQYSGDRPGIGYESIVACHAPGRSTWNGGGSHGVFIVNKGGDPRTGHQTQKPLGLMELLVRLFSDPGELILDPFAGSGTTGVAAIRLGRRFIGWEMKPGYVEVARKRLANAREQLVFDV